MSRARGPGPGRSPGAKRGTSDAGRPGRAGAAPRGARALVIAAILMACAVTVLMVTTLGRQRRGIRSRPEPTPADTMSITAAYAEATRLANAKQFVASLPYYRRVGALLPQPAREPGRSCCARG